MPNPTAPQGDSFSPFDTFHAPIDGSTSQSIEAQLAAMHKTPAEPVEENADTPDAECSESVVTAAEEHPELGDDEFISVDSSPASVPAVEVEQAVEDSSAPRVVAEQPATVADESIAAVEQPAAVTDEPIPAVEQPPTVAEEPIAAAEQPPTVAEEPIAAVEQPATVAEEPITAVEQPATVTEEPVAVVEQPAATNTAGEPDRRAEPVVEAAPSKDTTPAAVPSANSTVASHVTTVQKEETTPSPVAADEPPEVNGFRKLDLRPEIQQAVEQLGYSNPTDVQAEIIPHILAGKDVLAQSQTGTGKTAAFALPILSLIALPTKLPQVIVLTPTRELAMQVAESFSRYGQNLSGFRVAAVYGGQGYDGQIRQLRRGAPVVVGTPGRVIDLIKKGILDLSLVGCCVLDEADEMLNMGFLDDVEFVLKQTPEERQVALFSATMPGPIQSIANNYQSDPVRISIKRKTMTADAIRQRAVIVQHRDKLETLTRLLDVEETDGVIVFTKTREATVTVAEHLVREGNSAIALNGDMPQHVRERAIDQLKSGRLDILVATDVAARGLDVSRISHVFNYDVPQDSETYVHRIGRTGRAGRKGEAIILLSNSQRYKLKQIERVTRKSIEVVARPTADDINVARIARFRKKISDVIEGQDLSFFAELLKDYSSDSGKTSEEIAAALALMLQNGRPFLAEDRPRRERNNRRDERTPERGGRHDRFSERSDRGDGRGRPQRQQRRSGRVESGMERYRIEVGHQDNVKPGNIVGAVANEGGIEGEFIGPINIFDDYSTIDLPEGMPNDVYNVLRQVRVAGKPLQLKKATESDNHGETSMGHSQRRPGNGGPRRFSGKGRPPRKNRKFDGRKQRRHN